MKTLPLCAHVALPALIQPALHCDNLATFEPLMQEGLQTSQPYAATIEMVIDKKEFFGSPELKKACESYISAYS